MNDIIPDTNGRGGAKGSKPDGGGGSGGGGGGGGGGVRSFFLFLLSGGVAAVAGSLAWSHCLTPGQREALLEKAAPALGTLGAVFELALGAFIDAYDWVRAKVRDLPYVGGGRPGGDSRGAYEPLGAGAGGLDLDPDDHRSPPLFAARS